MSYTYHLNYQNPPSSTFQVNVPNATAASMTPGDLMVISQSIADSKAFTSPTASYKLIPKNVTMDTKDSAVLWENR